MNEYIIKEVKSKYDEKEFLQLPFEIYKNEKNWTPQIKQDVQFVFDKKSNKYFNHGSCIRWVLKGQNNKPIGRIAAFVNNKKAFSYDQPTGGLGFFECINDPLAAKKLFDTATDWLKKEGMEAVDGPINFGENNKFWGLLIENFSFPPYNGQNFNHEYYVRFFEDYGFKIYYKQITNYRKITDPLPEKYNIRSEKILNDPDFSIRTIEKNNLEKYVADFISIYNSAWVTHDNFKKMEFKHGLSLFKKMTPIMDEDLGCFIYHKNNPIAFCISIPDINPLIKKVKGNLNLLGKIKFLIYKQFVKVDRINGVAIGVNPEFQKMGVEGAMFIDTANRITRKNTYKDFVINWIGDFNPKMQYIIEEIGFSPISKLATYRKLFDESKEFKRSPIINK